VYRERCDRPKQEFRTVCRNCRPAMRKKMFPLSSTNILYCFVYHWQTITFQLIKWNYYITWLTNCDTCEINSHLVCFKLKTRLKYHCLPGLLSAKRCGL
jgi:hypothetical protein